MERAKQLMEMVAKYESLIYDTADYIWKNPETGYREWKTSAYMEEHFEVERAKQLMEMVAKYESLIYDTADYIWKNPETGYREWKTSAYMEEHFEALGYTLTKAGNS